jgi:two-component system sensor histidine kinase KdpD
VAVAAALGISEIIQPFLGIENVDLVSDRRRRRCGAIGLWPSLLRLLPPLWYNFSFFPDLHLHDHRSDQCRCLHILYNRCDRGVHFARAAAPRPWPRMNACARWNCCFSRKLAGVGTMDDVLGRRRIKPR